MTEVIATNIYRQLTEAFFSTFETGVAAQRNMVEQQLGPERFALIAPDFDAFTNRERLMDMAEKIYKASYTPEVATEILKMTQTKAWKLYMQHTPQVSAQMALAMQDGLHTLLSNAIEKILVTELEADEEPLLARHN